MSSQVVAGNKKSGILGKIRSILRRLDMVLPYAIVGSGAAGALANSPEALNAVGGLLVAYVLTKAAAKSLKESGEARKARILEKVEEATRKVLEDEGVNVTDVDREISESYFNTTLPYKEERR